MADVNVQIKQKNGALWDSLFPKTKAELVVENTTKQFVTATQKTEWSGKQNALGYTPVDVALKNVANGFVGLDSGIKIPQQFLPDIAITDTFVVTTQTEMLSLTAQVGDVCVRTDINKSYILKVADATVIGNWQVLLSPLSPIATVNGKTGAVVINATDVGLGNVTNESKTTMFANPTFTGSPKAPTQTTGTNDTTIATTSFVKNAVDSKSLITVSSVAPTTSTDKDLWYEIV